MAQARFPSFNGLEKELFALRAGLGLSIVTIEKINNVPHVLFALGVAPDGDTAPSDQALAARDALVKFIDGCPVLDDDQRVALRCIFNLDPEAPYYGTRLTARRIELEQLVHLGRRRVQAYETASVRMLAEQLLNASRKSKR